MAGTKPGHDAEIMPLSNRPCETPLTGPLPMRICIYGAGAVGSHFAVRLALAGHDVSCVMRGAHLKAVQANGLRLRVGAAEFAAKVNASDDPSALGKQDVVISTLKATGM